MVLQKNMFKFFLYLHMVAIAVHGTVRSIVCNINMIYNWFFFRAITLNINIIFK